MADITMCTNIDCPNAAHCYRVQATANSAYCAMMLSTPNSAWQSMATFQYEVTLNGGIKCDNYIKISEGGKNG